MANKPVVKSNKSRNILLGVVAGIILLLGAAFINFFVYPFTTTHPNYSDIEAVYNSIEVPDSWELISITKKTGPAGRSCYMGNDITGPRYCHSISAKYQTPSVMTTEGFYQVFSSLSCDKSEKLQTGNRSILNCSTSDAGVQAIFDQDLHTATISVDRYKE